MLSNSLQKIFTHIIRVMNALEKTISILGSQAALARAVGVSQVAVSGWVSRGSVPVLRCVAVEAATGGRVTRKDLRPRDWREFWPELT